MQKIVSGEFFARGAVAHFFVPQALGGTIWDLVQVMSYGRLPAQISFLAGNLREAVLGRNQDHLDRSRRAAEAIRDEQADSPGVDAYTRERFELLHAVSESLDRAQTGEAGLDKVALSHFAVELSLLESLQSNASVTSFR